MGKGGPHHRHSLGCFRAPTCVSTPWLGLLLLQPGGLWGCLPSLYFQLCTGKEAQATGLTPATTAPAALSRRGLLGPNEARLVLASVAPPCLLSVPQQQVTHLTTGSRAPGTRPRDLDVPWTLGGGREGVSGDPMSVWWGLSLRPLHVLFCVCLLGGSVPRAGRKGGSAAPCPGAAFGHLPCSAAILQPLARQGAGSRQHGGFSKRPEPPIPPAPRNSGCTSARQVFPGGPHQQWHAPVPGPARKLCAWTSGCVAGEARVLPNPGLCFSIQPRAEI